MASEKSYSITLNNNKTEKEAIDYLISIDPRFLNPDLKSRKLILNLLGLDGRFRRAFDLIMVEGHRNSESLIELHESNRITLIELKTTRKFLPKNPRGFFFGATENEFDIARQLGEKYMFCFVCLHPEAKSFSLKSLEQVESMIKTKRTQFQINLIK